MAGLAAVRAGCRLVSSSNWPRRVRWMACRRQARAISRPIWTHARVARKSVAARRRSVLFRDILLWPDPNIAKRHRAVIALQQHRSGRHLLRQPPIGTGRIAHFDVLVDHLTVVD